MNGQRRRLTSDIDQDVACSISTPSNPHNVQAFNPVPFQSNHKDTVFRGGQRDQSRPLFAGGGNITRTRLLATHHRERHGETVCLEATRRLSFDISASQLDPSPQQPETRRAGRIGGVATLSCRPHFIAVASRPQRPCQEGGSARESRLWRRLEALLSCCGWDRRCPRNWNADRGGWDSASGCEQGITGHSTLFVNPCVSYP